MKRFVTTSSAIHQDHPDESVRNYYKEHPYPDYEYDDVLSWLESVDYHYDDTRDMGSLVFFLRDDLDPEKEEFLDLETSRWVCISLHPERHMPIRFDDNMIAGYCCDNMIAIIPDEEDSLLDLVKTAVRMRPEAIAIDDIVYDSKLLN